MTSVFLIIADRKPVIAFATRDEAERFCSRRPDLECCEFPVPDASAGLEVIKNNMREFFALKQRLNKGVVTDDLSDEMIETRFPIHQQLLEWLRGVVQRGPNPMFAAPGQCQEQACPGRAFEAMLSLP